MHHLGGCGWLGWLSALVAISYGAREFLKAYRGAVPSASRCMYVCVFFTDNPRAALGVRTLYLNTFFSQLCPPAGTRGGTPLCALVQAALLCGCLAAPTPLFTALPLFMLTCKAAFRAPRPRRMDACRPLATCPFFPLASCQVHRSTGMQLAML